ncbi:hypothetical protein PH562_18800 [Rhizobium sp. CNPSo 4062]|uniref:phage regulatory CII family protein n=1 Tax=Rhizobium sp. CNPSo 4062 TaxID=3021410 RepID=UPI00254BEFDA|nr:phage regulatory CII family protein [Rhizobium sp. CNPSo 4062]MDK4704309.1 hypothetical protein [Rhizobium sp. CNPSo 4062]
MRIISEEEIRSLKGVTEASYTLGGGIRCFELLTRVNASTLSKYSSFNDENANSLIPIDVAIEADRQAKSPVIAAGMARLLGYRLVPDEPDTARGPVTEQDAHDVLRESMDVSRAILDALLNKHVDALERKRIAKEAREAIRAIEQVLVKIENGDDE